MADLALISTELWLAALSIVVLVVDLISHDAGKRWAGWICGLGIVGLLLELSSRTNAWGIGFWGMWRFDALAWYMKGLFLLAAGLVVLMTRRFGRKLDHGHGEFYLLILYATLGMMVLASIGDLLMLFIGLELVTFSLYIMTAYLRTDARSVEAGMKYLILGALSSGLVLFGIAFLYGATGSTQLSAIRDAVLANPLQPTPLRFGLLLVLSGLAFKIAAVPFHLWVPDVYEGAPTPVTAFLAIGSKTAGFAVLLRIAGEVMAPGWGVWAMLLAVMAAMTMLYGNLAAMPQLNIKRLLGYSSIGHAGYMLMGLAAGTTAGATGVAFYLLTYLLTNACAFFVVVLVGNALDSDELSDYSGLSRRSPQLAAALFIALLSLAGVPPLAGFFGKLLLFKAVVEQQLLWLALIGAANVVFSLYYYMLIVKRMYMVAPKHTSAITIDPRSRLILYALCASILILGTFPAPILNLASSATQALF